MSDDTLQPTPVERKVAKAFEAIRNSDVEYENWVIQISLRELTTVAGETMRRMEIVELQGTLANQTASIRHAREAILAAEARLAELGPL